jgi:hypothetical protein
MRRMGFLFFLFEEPHEARRVAGGLRSEEELINNLPAIYPA